MSRCRCRADGVSWVISSNDITYHSSSFPPDVGVGEDVVVGEDVGVDKGVDVGGGAKDLSILTKNLKYVDKRLIFEKRFSNSIKDFKYRRKFSTKW